MKEHAAPPGLSPSFRVTSPKIGCWSLALLLLPACGGTSDVGTGPDGTPGGAGSSTGVPLGGSSSSAGTGASASTGGSVGSAGSPVSAAGTSNAGGSGNAGDSNGGDLAGSMNRGGSSNAGSGSSSSGGVSSGGVSSAGAGRGGSNNGSAGRGGATNNGCPGSTSGGTPAVRATTTGGVFSQDRFHFGTIDSVATRAGTALISQLDFFTSGWMLGDTFDHKSVCDEAKGALANLIPIQVAYVSAAHVKRQDRTTCDCNVTQSPCVAANDLCHVGAQRISQQFTAILNAYKSYSQGFAACYGTTKPIVFELEPDWYQYTTSSQTQPWTPALAGQMLAQIVEALKSSLPNARFSIDASPWVAPCNGGDNGKQWYSNFDLSLFTFVNTSGGGTNANTAKIRNPNGMTWAGLSQVTGKPILADTGYGANGAAAGEDALWNDPVNINARIADGVVSISQYTPKADWSTRVSAARSQLNPLQFKP